MNKLINGALIIGALTLGTPEKSKAQDIVERNKLKVEKTIDITNNKDEISIIIDKELDKYDLTDDERIKIKEVLNNKSFIENYSNAVNINSNNNSLNIQDILLILILFAIILVLFNQRKNKNNEGALEKLREAFDMAPIPISIYRNDGYPEIWNKQLEKEFGYAHKEVIEYFEEMIEKTDNQGKKHLEKRGEVMSLIYKNTNEHKDLDNVQEYLSMLKDIHKDGYSNIPFTGTTAWGERKTFLWTTRPMLQGGTIRFAIPKNQKVEELEELLRQDILTGAYNRKALNEDFHKILTSINRDLDPKKYTICLIDLDDFKSINDKYGHTTGDMILNKFCQYIISNIRGGDKFYRIGGDEFILIIDSDKNNQIISKLDNLRKKFWEKIFIAKSITKSHEIQIGSSWGLQTLNIKDYHNSNLTIDDTTKIFDSLKDKMDEYLYGVKYYKLIKNDLVATGKIQEDWKEKNAIANVILDDNGELVGIEIIGNYTKFTLSVDEINEIEKIKMSLDQLRS